jgi:uncharacterized protein
MANTSRRGFASMDAAKQREIASKGGKAAHAKGTAHEFTSDEARVAGRKGGEAVSRDRAHMSAIGREGGHSRGARARATTQQTPGNNGNGGSQSFEGSNRGSATNTDRGNFNTSASERGNSNERANSNNNRSERTNDRQTENDRFATRDEI